jgi:hypothetical protein
MRHLQNVVGLFQKRAEAERAIHRLQSTGVKIDAISVAMKDTTEFDDFAEATGVKDLSGEGATAGAVSGAAVGTLIGLAIAGSTLVLPGLGTFLVGGPLAAALAGAGLGAASGGVLGALIGEGIPEHEAQRFAEGLEEGQIIVAAEVSDEMAPRVREIFLQEGSPYTHAV